jgi:hypothetical protein
MINNKFHLELPNIILDKKIRYKVGIIRLYFKLNKQDNSVEDKSLLSLNTNLIDRSSCNPKQSIVFFNYKKGALVQYHNAHYIQFQPVYLYEFSNASFQLRDFQGKDPGLEIRDIFIQLEIVRDDNYGRF